MRCSRTVLGSRAKNVALASKTTGIGLGHSHVYMLPPSPSLSTRRFSNITYSQISRQLIAYITTGESSILTMGSGLEDGGGANSPEGFGAKPLLEGWGQSLPQTKKA